LHTAAWPASNGSLLTESALSGKQRFLVKCIICSMAY